MKAPDIRMQDKVSWMTGGVDESAVEVQCAATVLLGRNNLSSWLVFEKTHPKVVSVGMSTWVSGGQIERLDFTVHIAHRR